MPNQHTTRNAQTRSATGNIKQHARDRNLCYVIRQINPFPFITSSDTLCNSLSDESEKKFGPQDYRTNDIYIKQKLATPDQESNTRLGQRSMCKFDYN